MILVSIYELAEGTTRLVVYEDIVVAAWKLFPLEFGLRGYADRYPDSSGLHKPLYGRLKRERLVRMQNKRFGLTESGLVVAGQLIKRGEPDSEMSRVRRERIDFELSAGTDSAGW